jgi:hypothetical protein
MILALSFGRRGRLNWYDPIFVGLALLVVYPDSVIEKISDITGKTYGLMAYLGVVLSGVAGLTILTITLLPNYPKLQWWYPVLFTAGLAVFRSIHHVLVSLFD